MGLSSIMIFRPKKIFFSKCVECYGYRKVLGFSTSTIYWPPLSEIANFLKTYHNMQNVLKHLKKRNRIFGWFCSFDDSKNDSVHNILKRMESNFRMQKINARNKNHLLESSALNAKIVSVFSEHRNVVWLRFAFVALANARCCVISHTEKTSIPFPFKLNGIWLWGQFFLRF